MADLYGLIIDRRNGCGVWVGGGGGGGGRLGAVGGSWWWVVVGTWGNGMGGYFHV